MISLLFKKLPLALALSSLLSPTISIAKQTNDQDEMEVIEVQGRAQTYYRVSTASFGSKTPTEFLDLSRSVQVLPEQLILDQGATEITDLYRTISGVNKFSYSQVNFRGFRQRENIRYDGVDGDPFGGFSIPHLFNIEQVEVIKGPNGIFGSGQPGGMINYVTKKPGRKEGKQITIELGSDKLQGINAELDMPVTDALAVRAGAFYQTEETFRNNTDHTSKIFDTGVRYYMSEDTDLTLQYNRIEQKLNGNRLRGVPADDEGNFLTDISWSTNEPEDYQNIEADVYQAIFEHQFTDNLTSDVTLRYFENTRSQFYHDPQGAYDSDSDGMVDTMEREVRRQLRENQEFSLTANFILDIEHAGFEHTFLFGGDFFDAKSDRSSGGADPVEIGGTVPSLNLFTPEYGYNVQSNDFYKDDDEWSDRQDWSLYLQDQIRFNQHWLAMANVRYENYNFEEYAWGDILIPLKDSSIVYSTGVMHQPNKDVSLYANYAEGYEPQGAGVRDKAGKIIDPELSEQFEIGLKTEFDEGRFQLSTALYQINKENITEWIDYINGVDIYTSFAQVRSRGFEFDLVGDIAKNWSITSSYAFNRVVTLKDADGNSAQDEKFANAPKHTFGLWTRYDLGFINSAISFGTEYVSDRYNLHDQTVKSYTIFDASWQTQFDSMLLQVNIKNLTNKEYAESGFQRTRGNFPGTPRTVSAKVTYKF